MSLRAIAVGAGTVVTGVAACLMGTVIAASPAQAPTLNDCPNLCPVVTPEPARWEPNTDREGWRSPLPSPKHS